ncbi:RNA methyltransferase [Piscinibacter sp. HJYY11]|uniref:TrmH family RNA methyltransferase n=1 Tax=Piscinibacter sp. HJYY11 TaxID=2801333 RepID=UPI00191D9F04|nr:RNA methyltransferase [Piscinibacter sp. HJYY11]MBL0726747.1 RNA methyltransferase [Piscinibacter sp. HJYY11]
MSEPRVVTSRDNPLLVKLRKLAAEPAAYRKLGQLWVEGDHLCDAFLKRGGRPAQAVITEAAWEQPALRELARAADVVIVIPLSLMAALSTLESPAPLGFVLPWSDKGAIQPLSPTVILDRLQDAGNVGTVLRTAAAFGFTQCIALKGTAALWSGKVLRAGMGAHFGLNLVEQVAEGDLDALRSPLLGTSSHAPQALHEVDLPWPCAWVMGHEGQGMSAGLAARCVQTLRIPQPGGEESLNVGAAAAICLYESTRQRL